MNEPLLPALSGAHGDHPQALHVVDRQLSWAQLAGAAGAIAARVAGAPAVAVHAAPTLETVVAIVGCLLAGVPVVPIPADAGPLERDHIVRGAGPALVLA